MAIVCKQFTFHAAHRLDHHQGQCKRLHGHSYKLEIAVEGPIKGWVSGYPTPDEGMVVDFDLLKSIYKEWIEPHVEHQFLNETVAPFLRGLVNVKPGEEAQTTAENLAMWMQHVVEGALAESSAELKFIRLWETPTSYVEV